MICIVLCILGLLLFLVICKVWVEVGFVSLLRVRVVFLCRLLMGWLSNVFSVFCVGWWCKCLSVCVVCRWIC